MREIYYKEGEHINNKKEYIINFFKSHQKYCLPMTYYKDTGFIQCRRKMRRSFNDLFWLFKSKFKTATKGELARILLNKNNKFIGLFYCDDIGKTVLEHKHDDTDINVSGFINEPQEHTWRCHYMDESFPVEGPNFDKLVQYATRSKTFDVKDIEFSLVEHKNKYLK